MVLVKQYEDEGFSDFEKEMDGFGGGGLFNFYGDRVY